MKNILLYFCLATTTLWGQTLSDKLVQKENAESSVKTDALLKEINERICVLRAQLQEGYHQVQVLHDKEAEEEKFHALLADVNSMKQKIYSLEKQWREIIITDAKQEEEGYALWDQEETTLAHLIIEYGALDYLYIVPPEMANMKLNMHSNVPIPRESWNDVLEIILTHNGIGIKNINPYARQLYLFKQEPACIERIASSLEQLLLIPEHSRVFYVFSPPIEHIKSVQQFLEKFSDHKHTFIYQIGSKLGIVSNREEVQKILHLYQTVWGQMQGKVSRVIPIVKMSVKEMEKIVQSFFSESLEKMRPHLSKSDQEGLTIFPLLQGNSLVFIGRKEVVDRAERVVRETEDQLQNPAEMTVYLYPCRHSSPNDLAQILEKVYTSLLAASSDTKKEAELSYSAPGAPFKMPPDGYPPVPPLVVAPKPINSNTLSTVEIDYGSDHFIPDPKTGTLLMVVRRDALGKIKDLIRNLDIPKKMVQIEVLLFEKQLNCENSLGMNLLKLGTKNILQWTSNVAPSGSGVLEFLLHNNSSKHFPAYDLAYSFLMSQDDIQLNAAPSIVTVNQTPATISIVEEISINNGAAPLDTNKGTAFEKSFSRAQYGITITLVPTIHLPSIEQDIDDKGFVTLKTNVTFDTTRHDEHKDRPLVNRRHIENEVCIADGQTVILGGLRRRASQDKEQKIPLLGDIPGLGKLFGATKLRSNDTEMFIFITPKIILDAKEQLEQILYEELKKRPGDQPEFLDCLVQAQEKTRQKKIEAGLASLK